MIRIKVESTLLYMCESSYIIVHTYIHKQKDINLLHTYVYTLTLQTDIACGSN